MRKISHLLLICALKLFKEIEKKKSENKGVLSEVHELCTLGYRFAGTFVLLPTYRILSILEALVFKQNKVTLKKNIITLLAKIAPNPCPH